MRNLRRRASRSTYGSPNQASRAIQRQSRQNNNGQSYEG